MALLTFSNSETGRHQPPRTPRRFEGSGVHVIKKDQKEISTVLEWASLMMSLVDLYRQANNLKRLEQAIIHARFCMSLITRNKHTAIGCLHLEPYVPKATEPRDR